MPETTDIAKQYAEEIGLRIKKIRQKKGFSLESLGLEIGLTRMQVHRIEKGSNITLKSLLKLALALDVTPDYLLKIKMKYKKQDLEKLTLPSKKNKG